MGFLDLDSFCGDTFWNESVSWNTTTPDFTPCFEKTVLAWLPCLFLWLFSSLEVFYLLNSKYRDIPWNWLNISKMTLVLIILAHCLAEFIHAFVAKSNDQPVYSVDFYTPAIKFVTFCLALALMWYNRKRGMRASGLLFFFWMFFTIFGLPQLRTIIAQAVKDQALPEPAFLFISYIVFYTSVFLSLVLNFFAEPEPRFSEYAKVENMSPEGASSFPGRLLFSWFSSLAWKGYRNPLEQEHLWQMNHQDTAQEIVPLYDKYWDAAVLNNSKKASNKVAFMKRSGSVEFSGNSTSPGQASGRNTSILLPLCKAFGPTFLFGAFLKFINDLLTFVSPQVLKLLIAFVSGDEPMWKGYAYAVLLFVTATCQTMLLAQYFYRMSLVGLRIRTALISSIYRKALRISNTARKESTVGEVVNLMAVDAQRFMDLTNYLNMLWSAPLQIVLALYFLWQTLGPSVLAGLAVMIILIPINGWVANKVKTLQIKQMKNKDERVKLMNEILSGIKVLKLYAWEPSFEQQVMRIREKEMKVLRQSAYLNSVTSFIWACAPFLVSLVTLFTYVIVDENNVLDAEKAFVSLTLFNIMRFPLTLFPMFVTGIIEVSLVTFAVFVMIDVHNILDSQTAFVSLSLFNILRFPLSMLPMLISNLVQTGVSVKRINKFMNAEELDLNCVQHDKSEMDPVVVENGTFSWGGYDEESIVLRNINLHVKEGSLVAVVGTVGSGKSSLLSAILGEMDKLTGRVNTKGAIAYVPQQAWIQNATLKDNILFGRSQEPATYTKIVRACALQQDFDMLPAADMTEIGEKGINLSGGQKQRVSLARAVYSDSDMYLLDDPLSAVDSHVGKHIFEQVIGPQGLLKKKTRILVTHAITYLPEVDQILVIKDGRISESGTYKQLLAQKGAFADFLEQYLQEVGEDAEIEVPEEVTQLLEGNSELRQRLNRQKSHDSDNSGHSLQRRRSSSGSNSSHKELPPKNIGEKLIEVEKTETGSVKKHVYMHYMKSVGVFLALSTILLNFVVQVFSIGSNLWLSEWSSDTSIIHNGTQDTNKRDMYLGVYAALGLGQAITRLISSFTLYIGCIHGSKWLHVYLLINIMRSPMMFFDITPIGRVLNRFSKDIDVVDNVLPMAVSQLVATIALYIGGIHASIWLHLYLLSNSLRSPMTFFDTTPTGRILNRFSKDIDVLDNALPRCFYQIIVCFYGVKKLTCIVHSNESLCQSSVYFSLFFVFHIWSVVLLYLGCLRVSRSLHSLMLENLLRTSVSFFDVTPVGRILNRFSKDVDVLDNRLPQDINGVLRVLWKVLATLTVISYTTPIFVSIIIPIGIVYFFVQRFYVATSRQLKRLESVSRSPIYSHFGESVTGATSIRAYGVQQRFISESENRVDINQVCLFPSLISNRWLAVRLETVGNLIIFFSALFAVLSRDTTNAGLVGLSVSYSLQITQTLNWLVRMTSDVETNIVAVERIKEYGETPQEAAWQVAPGPPSSWPDQGEVKFDNYQVRYREGLDLVLRGVNFTVRGGEKVGIVGRTGAGKSSLTLCLFRILEAAGGQIYIDGLDIAKMGLHDLRSRLTIIPQDPVLFSGTLRMNMDPFDSKTDEEVWAALELAHLKHFVKGLAAGLQHQITEGGDNLRVIVLDKGFIKEFDSPPNLLKNKSSVFYGMAKDANLV